MYLGLKHHSNRLCLVKTIAKLSPNTENYVEQGDKDLSGQLDYGIQILLKK